MNKIKNFTDEELKKYSSLLNNLTLNSSDYMFIEDIAEGRFFFKMLPTLQDYLKKIEEINIKADGTGILEIFKSDEKYKEELLNYKKTILHNLNRLENCNKCICSKCNLKCPFKPSGCIECKPNKRIVACDKERYVFYKSEEQLKLCDNDKNDKETIFYIVAELHDRLDGKKYIYLKEVGNDENEQLLEFKIKINGDIEYLSLETEERIDEIYNIYVKHNFI
ncbi:DUF1292 domain-containing protein [Clostridium perfringens]|uniref:DUF1292 domain-containing protein n=1 Tax=Clostridium perfringens TaxID=1502 RepID=A0A140GS57_CLOPF|nr:DUF1292 domain-containing protein [Clostridium perfringens]AMN31366.1 hypothetical protein JFP838_pA0450 [Clostridium perfringens]